MWKIYKTNCLIKRIKMKKAFMIVAITLFLAVSCGKKESETEEKAVTEVAKDTLTDFDRYEGKILKGSNNQWYLIKDGQRWRTNSIPASVDYLKTLPAGVNGQIEEVIPIQTLEQFPEVGELYPNVIFKKDENKTAN
jgi:hypothetical protein